jgi:hypothetical protein
VDIIWKKSGIYSTNQIFPDIEKKMSTSDKKIKVKKSVIQPESTEVEMAKPKKSIKSGVSTQVEQPTTQVATLTAEEKQLRLKKIVKGLKRKQFSKKSNQSKRQPNR